MYKRQVLNNSQTSFSRFGVASSDKSHVDDDGAIGVTQGIPDGEAMAWSDLRTLSDTQIRSLARNIDVYKRQRQHHPFAVGQLSVGAHRKRIVPRRQDVANGRSALPENVF